MSDYSKSLYLKFVSSSAVQLTVKDGDSYISCDVKQPHSGPFRINCEYIYFSESQNKLILLFISRPLAVMLYISEGKMIQILTGLGC